MEATATAEASVAAKAGQGPRWRDPVFIAGPSRSGTAMMSRLLRSHPMIGLARETHYFEDLRPRTGNRPLAALSPAQRDRALDYFCGLSDRAYGKHGDPRRGWLDRETLLAQAAEYGDDLDALFEVFCKLSIERKDPEAVIWGEKTPRNVFRIDDILEAFPRARILCMVRDPRAAVASYRDWQYHQGDWGGREKDADFMAAVHADYRRAQLSYHIVISTLMWRGAANSALAGEARHGPERVMVLRYEDVVLDAPGVARRLCDWLGVPCDLDVLDVPLINSSGTGHQRGAGISREPMERWRGKLSPREIHVIQSVAGPAMDHFGYAKQDVAHGMLDLPRAFASVPLVAARAAWVNASRVGNVPAYAWRRFRAALR